MIINKIDFPIYQVLIVLSLIVGILYILLSLYNEKILNKKSILFFIMLFVFAIIFAKLFNVVFYYKETTFLKAPLASYGGLVGVIVASIVYEKIFPSKGKVIKYSIISLPLIYSFGKLACTFNGCCYGEEYHGIFNIMYPHIINKPLFPIQPLEVIIFFMLFLYSNTNKNKKEITYITIIAISILKFNLEFLRYSYYFLNPNQIFSIVLLIITLIVYKINHNH